MKKLLVVSTIAIVTAATVIMAQNPAPATAPAADKQVVARVNGKEIEREELTAAMKGLLVQMSQSGRSVPADHMQQFEHDVLDELINREVILQTAGKTVVPDLDAKVAAEVGRTEAQMGGKEEFGKALGESGITADEYSRRVRENLIVQETMRGIIEKGQTASEADAKKFYEENQSRFQQPDLVRARHILLRVPPAATDADKAAKKAQIEVLLTRVKAGEDFAVLAKEFSEDPGSGANGGDLGFFPKGAMVPEFDVAAFSLDVNKVSDVITTQFGYHILQVVEKQPAKLMVFDEVKERIQAGLSQQKCQESAREHIANLRKVAKVEVLLPPAAKP